MKSTQFSVNSLALPPEGQVVFHFPALPERGTNLQKPAIFLSQVEQRFGKNTK